jgi:opacity protein-like surface antigen
MREMEAGPMSQIQAMRLLLLLMAFAFAASAQDSGRSEVSLDFSGNFQAQATGLDVTDTASHAGGVLANYRYRFNRWSEIEGNYEHSRFWQHYTPAGTTTQANASEFTLAYVNTLGRSAAAGFGPFLEAGTGALIFSPIAAGSTVGGQAQARAVFLFGGGIDWRPARHVSLRFGYRGLIYQAADFLVANLQTTNAVTTMSEPYVGLVLRF